MRHRLLIGVLASTSWGCTGLALGIRAPGADTRVASGAIAVDDRTDTAFVLGTYTTSGGAGPRAERRLFAVDADGGAPRLVDSSDLAGDQRLLFPAAGVLLMTELSGGGERLTLYDRESFAIKRTRMVPFRYWGTRMSPSRRWFAVADNDDDATPIHLFDAESLEMRSIPHGGSWLEGMWLKKSDRLVAAIFEGESSSSEGEEARLRIVAWSIDAVNERDFAVDETGAWAGPELDLTVQGKVSDSCFSFTWIGVSPDDRYAAIPVRDATTKGYELLVVDLEGESVRSVPGAKGPVGFTGDGSTIVSYEWSEHFGRESDVCGSRRSATTSPPSDAASEERGWQLGDVLERMILIDVDTLATRRVETGPLGRVADVRATESGPVYEYEPFNFHVLGAHVVLAPVGDSSQTRPHAPLFLFDAATPSEGRIIEGRSHLHEFIQRPAAQDLWLVSHGELQRLDLVEGRLESIALGFEADHLNYLPRHDWLVLDQSNGTHRPTLVFFDPTRRAIVRETPLPE